MVQHVETNVAVALGDEIIPVARTDPMQMCAHERTGKRFWRQIVRRF